MIYEMKKEMFWERFWDLWQVSFGNRMPCPGCGMRPAQACGYGHRYWTGEFDCTAPDNEDGEIMCEECHHLYCAKCKEENASQKKMPDSEPNACNAQPPSAQGV